MAFSEEGGNSMVMPVAPMYGNGYGNNGFGNDGSWWILLLFILLGGWNNGFGGGYGGGSAYAVDGLVQRGFDQAAVMNGITGINSAVTSGFGDVQTTLCGGFAGVNAAVSNGFAQAEIANNARAMSNMQQMFGLQSQFADCCCENRLASCQTQNIIQNEGNATRFADANNTRDLLTAFTSGIQSIKDQLCDYRDAQKDDTIANLRQELMYSRGQASQVAQTAELRQSGANQLNNLVTELRSCPLPAQPVYGNTPIFTCNGNNNYSCGCGCGA